MANATTAGNVAATAGGMAAIGVTVTSISLLLGGVAVGLSCERWATGPRQCDEAWKAGLGGVAGGGLGLVGTWLKNPYLRRREDEPVAPAVEPEHGPIADPRGGPPPLVDPWPEFTYQPVPGVPEQLPGLTSLDLYVAEEEPAEDGLEGAEGAEAPGLEADALDSFQEQLDTLAVQLNEKIGREIQQLEQRLAERMKGATVEVLKASPKRAGNSGKGFAADSRSDGEGPS